MKTPFVCSNSKGITMSTHDRKEGPIYRMFGQGYTVSEPDPLNGGGNIETVMYRNDPWYTFLVDMPFYTGLALPLLSIPAYFSGLEYFSAAPIILGLLGVLFADYIFRRCLEEVPPSGLIIRQFRGNPIYFTDCKIVYIPAYMKIWKIYPKRGTVTTSTNMEGRDRYTVFVNMPIDKENKWLATEEADTEAAGTLVTRTGEDPPKKSIVTRPNKMLVGEVFLVIRLVFLMNLARRPRLLEQTYLEELNNSGARAITGRDASGGMDHLSPIEKDVLDAILSNADAIMQSVTIEQLMHKLPAVNEVLKTGLATPLAQLGIFGAEASIEHKDGPIIRSMLSVADAQVLATSRMEKAELEQNAASVEAEQKRQQDENVATSQAAAKKVVEKKRGEVATAEMGAQEQILKLKQVLAQISQVNLVARLTAVKGNEAQVFFSQLAELPPAETQKVFSDIAKVFKSEVRTVASVGNMDMTNLHPLAAHLLTFLADLTKNP